MVTIFPWYVCDGLSFRSSGGSPQSSGGFLRTSSIAGTGCAAGAALATGNLSALGVWEAFFAASRARDASRDVGMRGADAARLGSANAAFGRRRSLRLCEAYRFAHCVCLSHWLFLCNDAPRMDN